MPLLILEIPRWPLYLRNSRNVKKNAQGCHPLLPAITNLVFYAIRSDFVQSAHRYVVSREEAQLRYQYVSLTPIKHMTHMHPNTYRT